MLKQMRIPKYDTSEDWAYIKNCISDNKYVYGNVSSFTQVDEAIRAYYIDSELAGGPIVRTTKTTIPFVYWTTSKLSGKDEVWAVIFIKEEDKTIRVEQAIGDPTFIRYMVNSLSEMFYGYEIIFDTLELCYHYDITSKSIKLGHISNNVPSTDVRFFRASDYYSMELFNRCNDDKIEMPMMAEVIDSGETVFQENHEWGVGIFMTERINEKIIGFFSCGEYEDMSPDVNHRKNCIVSDLEMDQEYRSLLIVNREMARIIMLKRMVEWIETQNDKVFYHELIGDQISDRCIFTGLGFEVIKEELDRVLLRKEGGK